MAAVHERRAEVHDDARKRDGAHVVALQLRERLGQDAAADAIARLERRHGDAV
jgi:hypothetical protein